MRIGELAALAGVSTRTVRYYHRIGLLPEPERRLNGYREYGMREAVGLVRIRRLVELGLSLDEVRDAVGDDAGKDLGEILAELDADLAAQQEAIRRRRAVLAGLLKRAEAAGGLPAEGPVSAELAALFEDMARTATLRGGPEPVLARKDRELLATLEGSADPGHREWLASLTRALSDHPEAMARAYDVYARFDDLADAEPDDPRVEEVAEALADFMPEGSVMLRGDADPFAEALFADFPAAQAQVLRRAVELLHHRRRP